MCKRNKKKISKNDKLTSFLNTFYIFWAVSRLFFTFCQPSFAVRQPCFRLAVWLVRHPQMPVLLFEYKL